MTVVVDFYNCVFSLILTAKGLNENISHCFLHFFLDNFKMAVIVLLQTGTNSKIQTESDGVLMYEANISVISEAQT